MLFMRRLMADCVTPKPFASSFWEAWKKKCDKIKSISCIDIARTTKQGNCKAYTHSAVPIYINFCSWNYWRPLLHSFAASSPQKSVCFCQCPVAIAQRYAQIKKSQQDGQGLKCLPALIWCCVVLCKILCFIFSYAFDRKQLCQTVRRRWKAEEQAKLSWQCCLRSLEPSP